MTEQCECPSDSEVTEPKNKCFWENIDDNNNEKFVLCKMKCHSLLGAKSVCVCVWLRLVPGTVSFFFFNVLTKMAHSKFATSDTGRNKSKHSFLFFYRWNDSLFWSHKIELNHQNWSSFGCRWVISSIFIIILIICRILIYYSHMKLKFLFFFRSHYSMTGLHEWHIFTVDRKGRLIVAHEEQFDGSRLAKKSYIDYIPCSQSATNQPRKVRASE